MKKTPHKSYYFTLLELMICLAIVSLLGSLLSIQGFKMVKEHRFRSSLESLYRQMQQMQILCMSHGCDVDLHFFKEKNEYFYQFTTEAPIKEKEALIKSKLLYVASLSIDQHPFKGGKFTLYSTGRIEPSSQMGFHMQDAEEKALWIDFSLPIAIAFKEQATPKSPLFIPTMPKIKGNFLSSSIDENK